MFTCWPMKLKMPVNSIATSDSVKTCSSAPMQQWVKKKCILLTCVYKKTNNKTGIYGILTVCYEFLPWADSNLYGKNGLTLMLRNNEFCLKFRVVTTEFNERETSIQILHAVWPGVSSEVTFLISNTFNTLHKIIKQSGFIFE